MLPSIYVFWEVGLQRVKRHEEFDLYLYFVSFVPHDVCTCVFARLVYLLLITEKGVSKGKISLSKSQLRCSLSKKWFWAFRLKNQFLSRNLSQSNQNHFVFSNDCNFFPFQSENRFRAQRPIFNSADHQKWHKLLCSYFCKLVFE